MNDLHTYLMLVKRIHFYTMIAELSSVEENKEIVNGWNDMMQKCYDVVNECKTWIDSVDEDVRKEVFSHAKAREMISSTFL